MRKRGGKGKLDLRKMRNEDHTSNAIHFIPGPVLMEQIKQYMMSNGLLDVTVALKEMLSIAISMNPQFAVEGVHRKIAYDRHRRWLVTETYGFLNTLWHSMEKLEAELAYLKEQERTVDGEVISSTEVDPNDTTNIGG